MKNTIILKESVTSRLFKFYIGKGAKVNLLEAPKVLLNFLRVIYESDSKILGGDIKLLLILSDKHIVK